MELLKQLQMKDGEELVKEIKHHPVVIIPHMIISLLILILDFFLMYFLFLQGWWGVALFVAVIFMVLLYSFRMVFLYNRNKFIVTNQRIIDFEQPSFFEHYKNEVPLHKIHKMQIKKKGVFSAIFGYGTLKLTISGDVAPLELYRIPRPSELMTELEKIKGSENEDKKEVVVKDDPMSLILAETKLFSINQKEDLIERIGQQIDDESAPLVEQN